MHVGSLAAPPGPYAPSGVPTRRRPPTPEAGTQGATPAHLVLGQLAVFVLLVKGATTPYRAFGIDVAFLLPWAFLALLYAQGRPRRLPRWAALALAGYLSALLLATAFVGSAQGFRSVVTLANYAAALLMCFHLASAARRLVVPPVAAALVVHVALATVELLSNRTLFYGSWKLDQATRVGGITRVASTIADPNYFALTLLLLSAVLVGLSGKRWHRWLAGLALVLVPFTFSRAGMIALALSGVLAASRVRRGRLVPLLIGACTATAIVLCLSAIAFPSALSTLQNRYSPRQVADASFDQRRAVQSFGFDVARHHPVLGVGPGAFDSYSVVLLDPTKPFNKQTNALNTYLTAWLDGGPVALAAFAALLWVPTWRLLRRRSYLAFALAGSAVTIATLDTLTFVPLWVAMGLALQVSDPADERG